jgi:integrase/recombinase XerD
MRISEAIKLDNADIDWQEAVLLVRDSKLNKSRYLPVHASTLDALERYARERDRVCPTQAIRASSSRCDDDGLMTAPCT